MVGFGLLGLFIPGALHGVEASFLADTSARKLRTAVRRVVWSSRQPLTSAGAALSLLDGRLVAILPFVLSGSSLVMLVPITAGSGILDGPRETASEDF